MELDETTFEVGSRAQQLGRYVVLGPLGAGGMGTVVEAFDRTLDRKVAIKMLHGELDEQHTARLVREAQAMARLSHPNVVQVYEADVVGDQTFVVMELVDGPTLREWMVNQPRPSWQRCVSMFIEVGEGLAAAHAQGLIHRDFKPSNAVIDDQGRPRVLDFGLARRVESDLDAAASTEPDGAFASTRETAGPAPPGLGTTLTRTGAVMGTPAYMPPEQIKGAEADARSDQFSFCVSLYEAVYGERPFDGTSMMALMVSMASGALRPAPKGSAAPAALRAALVRGLALRPEDRWPSMTVLLGELRRLSAPRRVRGLAVGLILGLVGLGGLVALPRYLEVQERCTGASAQLEGVWDDTRRADVRAAIEGTELSYAEDTWTRVVPRLDDYARTWVTAHTDACEATRVRGEQTEDALELRMDCLRTRRVALSATVQALLDADDGTVERAVSLVEGLPPIGRCDRLERLRQLRQRVPPPEDPLRAEEVEDVRDRLAEVAAELRAGRTEDASTHVEPLVPRAEALEYGPLVAEALVHRGRVRDASDQLAEAEQDFERALTLAVTHGHDELTVTAMNELTWLVGHRRADVDPGLGWGRTAQVLSLGPEIEPTARAIALSHLSSVLFHANEFDESLTHLKDALAIQEHELGDGHTAVASTLGRIGIVTWALGRRSEALGYFERALAVKERALGQSHKDVAAVLNNLGTLQYDRGRLSESLVHQRRALMIYEQALGPDHTSVALTLGQLGLVLQGQGKLAEALSHQRRALAIEEHAYGPNHPSVVQTLGNIGLTVRAQGEFASALSYYRRAQAIAEETLGPEHPSVARLLAHIGIVRWQQGEVAEAEVDLRRALVIQEQASGLDHPHLAYPLVGLAHVALSRRDFEGAQEHAQRVISLYETGDEDPGLLAEARFALARALWTEPDQRGRARTLAQQARDALAASEASGALLVDLAEVEDWLRHADSTAP